MKAVIYLSVSKNKKSKQIAQTIKGDLYQLLPGESIPKFPLFKMIKLGRATVQNKTVPFAIDKIDYTKYDEIVLVFPIWAGRMAQYMKSFIDQITFKNKNITFVATSKSGRESYIQGLQKIEIPHNKITDIVLYKGTQIIS